MEVTKSSMHPSGIIEVRYCTIDQLHYLYLNDTVIHSQKAQPAQNEIEDAIRSDEWVRIINSVKKGNRERCSMRMYYHFLECLPPLEFDSKNFSFFNSEPVRSINDVEYYYFFERENHCYYIQLKPLSK